MKSKFTGIFLCITCLPFLLGAQPASWIRINQLGYTPAASKVAVWCSKQPEQLSVFEVVDVITNKVVYVHSAGKAFGAYGPFTETYRLDFSLFRTPGKYFLRAGNTQSPFFSINDTVYNGAADFCLRYMRQQRSGFNPFLKDSCHTHDGYTLYGPMPDSTHINVTGGWHDASDYLQYSTTTANATFHLLAAYRDFPDMFADTKKADGLEGKNGIADVLDEAKWGLDWLLKMHPRPDWMFNQLGDDRDHMGLRLPKEDNFYGKGYERPVYFNSGRPQVRGRFMNATTGTASTAGKFAGAFALGAKVYAHLNAPFAKILAAKAVSAWQFGLAKPGVSQTASVRSPYIYAEGDWMDDMELAAAELYGLQKVKTYEQSFYRYIGKDSVDKWMGSDTAKHYQYYPFNNLGIYELARQYAANTQAPHELISYYSSGLYKVARKAEKNAFNRGIPFIWCSNNLTVSFSIQCYWYRKISGYDTYAALEQANFDWLFGCNPWGTSMVYGLPNTGDTPVDPHSAFTHLKNYPIDGGLVDGPVYTSIYKGLIGIQLKDADEYAEWQSDMAVYHDDYGDYSTNEPTMDGTASLVYLLGAKENEAAIQSRTNAVAAIGLLKFCHGGIFRCDTAKKEVALVFTGDEFGEGLGSISETLQKQNIKASFFFTGRFYRNNAFRPGIKKLHAQQHLLGPHSDGHLLYCDWAKRDSTLVSKDSLQSDLLKNENAMQQLGIGTTERPGFYIPPYEWWNGQISEWIKTLGYRLFSFTPGLTSNADYTYPEMGTAYRSSAMIFDAIKSFNKKPGGLNGAIILIHAGTDPRREDKLYDRLNELVSFLRKEGYQFKRIDKLLQ